MAANGSAQHRPALALAELVIREPRLGSFTWTITPAGQLLGRLEHLLDGPSLVPLLAEITGGTPTSDQYERGADLARVTSLRVDWRGVVIDVWESAPASGSDVTALLRAVFAGNYPAELVPAGGR